MKTFQSIPACSRGRRTVRLTTVVGLALALSTVPALAQAIVDPDPEIFDGSKTKRNVEKQTPQTVIDDWEGPNLIIYDSDEDGPGVGGTGMIDGTQPGLDVGVSGGGLPGIPNPLAGGMGGAGGASDPSLQIPAGQQEQQQGAGGPSQNADTTGAAQSAARPSDVSIGDASQRIATTAQGQAGNKAAPADAGEQGAKEAGEDSTQVPSSANTNQSGNRGGGVEKGDAMPPDQI